jgi:repressor LexA
MARRAGQSGGETPKGKLPPNRIAEARIARGWNQFQLAELVGTSQQSISRYETSQRDFSVSVLLRLCEVLEVTASYLLCADGDRPATVDVPLLGSIAAGTPIDMDAADRRFPVPAIVHERFPDAFLLRVEGDSMNRILPNGSLALIDPGTDIDHEGQPYAVCIDEQAATIKRVRHTELGIQLIPDSTDPSYQTQVLTRGIDDTTLSVIGRVVWHHLPESQVH